MINLLPPEDKRQLRAARTNVLLIRYNIMLVAAVVFLFAAVGVTYVYLNNTKNTAQTTINDNQAKVSGYAPVEAEATQFRSNLATAKLILDNQVTYTKIILQIASLMPAGTILQNLNLDSSTFGTSIPLTAEAKDYPSALSLKDSFQKSPLFSDVHFDSITSSASSTTDNPYPIAVTLDVTIKKTVGQQ